MLLEDYCTNYGPSYALKNASSQSGQFGFGFKSVIAGGFGGIVSKTVTAPLERVKLLQQTGMTVENSRFKVKGCNSCPRADGCKPSLTRRVFYPVWSQLKAIYALEGIPGLFRGHLFNAARIFPFAGTVCLSYNTILSTLPNGSSSKQEGYWRFIAGASAGALATAVTHPLDTMRARVAVGKKCTPLSEIFGKSMFRELYTGLTPALFSMSAFVGIQNTVYDGLRLHITDPRSYLHLQPSVPLFLTLGAVAGGIAQTAVYPCEVIRRTMQICPITQQSKVAATTIRGVGVTVSSQSMSHERVFATARSMIRTHGVKSLFRGLTPTYLKVLPSVAITVTVRDAILGKLKLDD